MGGWPVGTGMRLEFLWAFVLFVWAVLVRALER